MDITERYYRIFFQDWEPYPHAGFGFVTFHQYPVSYLDKGVVYNSLECSPEMTDSSQPVVNLGHQDLKTKFKVVKVETTQPLKRGRWTCIDFTDKHTTPAPPASVSVSSGSDGGAKSIATSASTKTLTRTEVERHYSGGGAAVEAVTEASLSSGKEPERQVVEPEFTEERQEEVAASNKEEESDQAEHALTVETYLDNAKTGVTLPHDPVNSTSSKSNLNSPGSVPEVTKGKGLHIGLGGQQSVPVITATPHSPITNTTGAAVTGAPLPPDVSNLQKTIGQVIRLNDGTLAQVALAPLPPQQQLGNVIPNSGPGQMVQQQQQQSVLINAGQYMVPQPQVPPQPMQPQHQSQSNPQQSTIIQQSMKSSTNQQQNLVNYPPPGNIQQQMSSVGPHVPMQHQNTSMSAAAQLQQMIPPSVVSVSSSDSSGSGHPLTMMQSQFPASVSVSVSSPTKRNNSIISVSGNIHQSSRPVLTSSSQAGGQHGGVAFSYIQGAGAGILSLTGDREGGLVEKLELELGEQSREVDLGELDR